MPIVMALYHVGSNNKKRPTCSVQISNFESVYDSHLVEFADTEAVGPGSQMDVFKLPTLFLEALLLRLHFSFFSFSYSQKLQWKFSDFIPNKYECESIPLALTPHILSYASV